ncbi:MAG TPA: ABC transporter substrate-binding protein, partial [Motiliproteus sp.]
MQRIIFIAVSIFVGFFYQSSTAAAAPLQAITLQLKWVHAFQFAGYYAAAAKGFYRQAGLDVTILPADPGTDVPGMVLSGAAEYGVGTSSLLLERKAGKPLVVLGVIFQHSPLVLLTAERNATQGVHDLVDQRVMLEPQSDELLAYLKREQVPLSRLQLHQHSFNPQDLIDGRVDAISAYVTNERYFLDQAGFRYQTYTPRSAGIDFYGDNLFTSERELRLHPERVAAFRDASLKGWEYAMANPAEIIDVILSEYPTDYSRQFLHYEAEAMVPLLRPSLIEMGYMNTGRWQHIADTYAELGMLPADFPVETMLYQPNDRGQLGWVYRVMGIMVLLGVLLGSGSLYIYRANRRLDR